MLYGAAKLLIEFFARQPGRALELYVGKSDNVDYLLDYDHRGHTVHHHGGLLASKRSCSGEQHRRPEEVHAAPRHGCSGSVAGAEPVAPGTGGGPAAGSRVGAGTLEGSRLSLACPALTRVKNSSTLSAATSCR